MLNFEIAHTDAHAGRPARPQGTAPQRQTPTDTRPVVGVAIARTEFASTHLLPKPGAAHPSAPGTVNDRPRQRAGDDTDTCFRRTSKGAEMVAWLLACIAFALLILAVLLVSDGKRY